MRKQFRLDRSNGKFLGVCAGLSNLTGIDANIIRIGMVVTTLVAQTPILCIGYFVLAWIGKRRSESSPAIDGGYRGSSVETLRSEMTETDLRLAEIERYTSNPNAQLAREIDSLR